jgi:hypothetical protein
MRALFCMPLDAPWDSACGRATGPRHATPRPPIADSEGGEPRRERADRANVGRRAVVPPTSPDVGASPEPTHGLRRRRLDGASDGSIARPDELHTLLCSCIARPCIGPLHHRPVAAACILDVRSGVVVYVLKAFVGRACGRAHLHGHCFARIRAAHSCAHERVARWIR